jgi:hypothetical protein
VRERFGIGLGLLLLFGKQVARPDKSHAIAGGIFIGIVGALGANIAYFTPERSEHGLFGFIVLVALIGMTAGGVLGAIIHGLNSFADESLREK